MAPALTSCWRFSSGDSVSLEGYLEGAKGIRCAIPECVMFRRAPVAFRWTLISLDFANRVNGPRAPDRAILALLSSCVARLVIHPTALHWTSTFCDIICRIRGANPLRCTINTLFSARNGDVSSVVLAVFGSRPERTRAAVRTVDGQVAKSCASCPLYFEIRAL